MTSPVATVFMGSPATALPSLRGLLASPAVRVVGVVAQPDRPAGRRRRLQPCPVHVEADARGLPVLTPPRVGAPEVLEALRAWAPALIVVCAYGQLLPDALLNLPALGCFNLHFSLLPRWRGASPVQAALLAGDPVTGVSLQRMVQELDAGPIAADTPPLPILPTDTALSLGERLADAAGDLLARNLAALLSGDPPLREQDAAAVTRCRLIRKDDGAVDVSRESAAQVERKCRAYTPWPGCFAYVAGRRLGLVGVSIADPPPGAPPHVGTVLHDGRVRTAEGWLRLDAVRPEGKATMPFAAFRNGTPEAIGSRLTASRA